MPQVERTPGMAAATAALAQINMVVAVRQDMPVTGALVAIAAQVVLERAAAAAAAPVLFVVAFLSVLVAVVLIFLGKDPTVLVA
jgi:hypothetical protein